MGSMPSRQDVQRELGTRVSRGRHERILNLLFSHKTRVVSASRGRQTGAARVTRVLHPDCPKAVRKHTLANAFATRDACDGGVPSRRARYVFK
jgi:hypothetical protein